MMIAFTIFGFLCGSLMFSYWIGLILKQDLRKVGDGNPGAANLWKAAGVPFGLLGIALDFLKGFLPIWLWMQTGSVSGSEWILVALSPILGHAFSPFMKFHGGKGLAVSFGVWSALTQFQVSLVYAVILAMLWIFIRIWRKGGGTTSAEDGMHTSLGFLLLFGYLIYMPYPLYLHVIWFGNLLVLLWKNRKEWSSLLNAKKEPVPKHATDDTNDDPCPAKSISS